MNVTLRRASPTTARRWQQSHAMLRYWTARRATAQVVNPPAAPSEVAFGTTVTIARDDGRRQTWRIVGEDEADPTRGTLSYVSPVARALIGKRVGDVVRAGNAELKFSPSRDASGREPEVHHVAVGDHIVLAFQPHLAGIARAGFAAEGHVVVIGNGLGADEAALEVGVDHRRRLRRFRSPRYRPGGGLLRARGESR